jgi:hypothetical protein
VIREPPQARLAPRRDPTGGNAPHSSLTRLFAPAMGRRLADLPRVPPESPMAPDVEQSSSCRRPAQATGWVRNIVHARSSARRGALAISYASVEREMIARSSFRTCPTRSDAYDVVCTTGFRFMVGRQRRHDLGSMFRASIARTPSIPVARTEKLMASFLNETSSTSSMPGASSLRHPPPAPSSVDSLSWQYRPSRMRAVGSRTPAGGVLTVTGRGSLT